MNDLILSVVKERILPLSSDFIDYPSAPFETHLHHISNYLTKSILDQFVLVTHWSLCNASKKDAHSITEESRLTLALKNTFPREWLMIAETSPSYHLHLQRILQRYRFTLNETSIRRIHRIIEFFCYELIESAVIHASFKPMYQLSVADLQVAADRDPTLQAILARHRIFLVTRIPSQELIGFVNFPAHLNISIKGYRLLRAFIEQVTRQILRQRQYVHCLQVSDIERYAAHRSSV